MKEEQRQTRYIPVGKWDQHHPWPSAGGLRHLIFNKEEKGFCDCVVKVGKTVLIDESAFLEWMKKQKKR